MSWPTFLILGQLAGIVNVKCELMGQSMLVVHLWDSQCKLSIDVIVDVSCELMG